MSARARLSGNAGPEEELRRLCELGAVGDICQRFFDADGVHVDAGLGERTIGISVDQLRGARGASPSPEVRASTRRAGRRCGVSG